MHAITIRSYRDEDVSDLVAIFREAVRITARRDYTESQVRAWAPDLIDHAPFAQRCAAKSTWVAECAQRVAGFSDIEPDGHIDMLYVHPDFHRRRVARELLAHIEQCAQIQGLDRLYTEASITALPVFESVGFYVLAAQTVTVRGESMTNYRMEKQLKPLALR
jgi:putative acetyltransferase